MKKFNMVLLATILISAGSLAQKGNTLIGIGGEVALPTGEFGTYFKTGIGISTKALFGVGKAGHITFTGGFSTFKEIGSEVDWSGRMRIMPLLAGYRHNFNQFFIEPQAGIGFYNYKLTEGDEWTTYPQALFTWAASAGYIFNKQIEVSARYQNGSSNSYSAGLLAVRVGYNFSLKSSK
jgi:Outer membrane protein beta-barrel domain